MRWLAALALLVCSCALDDTGLDDRPWLERDGVTLHWAPGALPLDVYVADEPLDAVVAAGVAWWNGLAGRRLFADPQPALGDTLGAFADERLRAGLERAVLVRLGGEDPGHGEADLRYDRRDGRLLNAVVELHAMPTRPAVVHHEFGHVLGLAHSPDGLMAPRIPAEGPLALAAYQARAVRGLR